MRKLAAVLAIGTLALTLAVPALAADGKALYESKCAMCHGKDGVAKPMAKPARDFNAPAFAAVTVDDIVKVTTEGKNKMPAYKDKLKADEIKAVADHVKTLVPAK